VNAAYLIMSSAVLVGADPAPPPPPPAAPVVVSTGAGCNNCGIPSCNPCNTCDSKPNLLDRLKAKFGRKHSCGCAPACPQPCAPACTPAPAPCNTCNTCGSAPSRPNLLDKIKSWCGGRKKKAGPCCDPCGAYHLSPVAPATPATPGTPQEMPKPKEKEAPKTKEKGLNSGIPNPLPVPPTTGTGLTGSTSPY
jgi:hypothetical protein